MAQTKKTETNRNTKKAPVQTPRSYTREIWSGVCFLLGFFVLLGYFQDEGVFINFFSNLVKGIFGNSYFLAAPALFVCAVLLIRKSHEVNYLRLVFFLLMPVLLGSVFQVFEKSEVELSFKMFPVLWEDGKNLVGGGILGGALAILFVYLFSKTGAAVVLLIATVFAFAIVFWELIVKIAGFIRKIKLNREKKDLYRVPELKEDDPEPVPAPKKLKKNPSYIDIPIDEPDIEEPVVKKSGFFNKKANVAAPHEILNGNVDEAVENIQEPETEETPVLQVVPTRKRTAAQKKAAAEDFSNLIEDSAKEDIASGKQAYRFPPLSLLAAGSAGRSSTSYADRDELTATRDRLELTLRSFGIHSQISNIVRGPTVTRYEMMLEAGVKLNKLTNLADDIALSLGVGGVRIAPIPNKISMVGIEVPNRNVSTVYLREIISSEEFQGAKSKLTFAMGKNIGGEVIVGNIAKLPHLLIAGTTGSGKSVCLNAVILSIMYKSAPTDVKFIMIDPKMVEFKIYNGIPHLLVPVVTEAKKAAGALQWAVVEMMKRYRLFSEMGARDLEGYNEIVMKNGEEKIPQIVVFIDELADLMLVSPKEVEESICRVAQMGRAAGVHLVIATQSPRADVITGLMKANIPSRISFKVASALESRIILDAGGAADKLIGNGDMLYAPIGSSKPVRLQCAWVSDEEREKIVEYVKKDSVSEYSEEVMHQIEQASAEKGSNNKAAQEDDSASDYDELLVQAADVIFETSQASVSMLQRRLKLGYSRAARLIDQLEEVGLVGPFEGSKPRKILLTKQQWQEMQYVQGTAPAPAPKAPVQRTDSKTPVQTMFSEDDLF